jgi:pimeloyl-ACP methyl ester carboxylesterase
MPKEPLSQIRDDPAHHATVVFVHGFTGDGLVTWRNLADRVAADTRLSSWDLWTITYGTSWLPDVSGIWTADADLTILAKRLGADLGLGALARYRAVVLIAHSMGGLIVQKALLDFPAVATRTNAVVLFGTPSAGLVKARTLRFWKRQFADMTAAAHSSQSCAPTGGSGSPPTRRFRCLRSRASGTSSFRRNRR